MRHIANDWVRETVECETRLVVVLYYTPNIKKPQMICLSLWCTVDLSQPPLNDQVATMISKHFKTFETIPCTFKMFISIGPNTSTYT